MAWRVGCTDRSVDHRFGIFPDRVAANAEDGGECVKDFLDRILSLRWFALLRKEFRQISRNKRLVVMLIIPPTLNVVLFGYALNPTVDNLRLGVVDESRTYESRELISAMVESG